MKLNEKGKIPLVRIYTKEIAYTSIVFDEKINQGCYCCKPYPGYPKGCPNFNRNPLCPPNAFYSKDRIQNYDRFTLIWAFFSFQMYKIRLKLQHPDWSEKQLGNSRLWQSQIKAMIKEKVNSLAQCHTDLILGCGSGMFNTPSMEASGIDVVQTCINNGIPMYFAKEGTEQTYYILCCLLCQTNEMIAGLDY